MSAAGFLALYTALGVTGAVPHPLNPKNRASSPSVKRPRPYERTTSSTVSRTLSSSSRHDVAYNGLVNPLEYVPRKGEPSAHQDGFRAIDVNGTYWKTVEGRWILDDLHYRHNL